LKAEKNTYVHNLFPNIGDRVIVAINENTPNNGDMHSTSAEEGVSKSIRTHKIA